MAHIELIGLAETKSPDGKIWKLPYAFPVIVSQLRMTTHTFNIIDTHLHKKTLEEVIDYVKASKSHIFGISGWSHHYLYVKILSKIIREAKPDAFIIVGGIIAGNYRVLLDKTDTDIVSVGAEGELILPEILSALDSEDIENSLRQVDGISFKSRNNSEIIVTKQRKTMSKEEYASYPMPAYDYFDAQISEMISNINARTDVTVKAFPILTARGCPFKCTFCGHLYGQKFLRKKWDDFFAELKYLIDRYGAQGFFNYDTNMFLTEAEVDEYCKRYKEGGYTFKMCAEMRTNFGNKEMFSKMKEGGILVALLGYESGSQYMLKRMRKGFDVDKMKQVIRDAVDAGLMLHGNFIFGTPGENRNTIMETVDFMIYLESIIARQKKEMEKDGIVCTSSYGCGVLIPSPTSELYDAAIKNGLITDEEKYLISLCDDENSKLSKGSSFRIKLVDIGGDVNMSEFSSKEALKSFVALAISFVKLSSLKFSYSGLGFYYKYLKLSSKVFFLLVKHLAISLSDTLSGKSGYFDADEEAKYSKYKRPFKLRRYLGAQNGL